MVEISLDSEPAVNC